MEHFLLQAAIYLIASVFAVPVAVRLGLGSVLGYLLAGIAVSPLIRLFGSETAALQGYAEFGVVMMLFLIGLELEPRALWAMRKKLIGQGGAQIVLTILAVTGAGMTFGLNWREALAIGAIFAMSSTAIVLQTLNERGLMQVEGGRSAFAVLLAQDISVIPILALLPLLAEHAPHSEHGAAIIADLPGWLQAVITLGAIAAVVLAGRYLTRPLFLFIDGAHLREMYTATALAIVTAIALLMTSVGLSPALGTFVAGVVLANTEFRHELEASIEPFKGLLLGLFFITVGAGIDLLAFAAEPVLIVGLALGLMALKFAVLWLVGLVFNLKGEDRWLFALGLSQAGEFGFVLVGLVVSGGVLEPALAGRVLLIVALSMMLTPLAFILFRKIAARLRSGGTPDIFDTIDEQQPVIIAGIGRFGQVVNRLVTGAGFKTTVIDHDLEMVEVIRKFGFKSFFGDPTNPELLHSAGLATAQILVVAVDDRKAALTLVSYARRERPDLTIIARAYDRMHTFQLYRAGANKIVREMFDSSLRVGRYVLEELGLSEFEAHEAEATFFRLDRSAMLDLAKLWDPDVPAVQNAAYVARAKALNKDLETALMGQISTGRQQQDAAE